MIGKLWFQVWKEIFWNVCFLWCWKSFGCSGIVPTIFPVRPVSVISKFLVLEQNKAKLALSISTIMRWEINGLSIWNLKLITQLWSWGGQYCVFECACALSLELSPQIWIPKREFYLVYRLLPLKLQLLRP